MAQPQGFRTFQILLAIGFLAGFFAVLLFFFWKISDLNTDLNRISVASSVKVKVFETLRDGRACELNFAGLTVGEVPIALRKIVNLRKDAILRVNENIDNKGVVLNSLRLLPNHSASSIGKLNTTFYLELVFSDIATNKRSPVKLQVTGQGEYNDRSEFTVKSCIVGLNDFEG